MEPIAQLADEIYRDRVLRARRVPPERKLLAGGDLFDSACLRMLQGIRNDYPDADEATVRDILHGRMTRLRALRSLHVLQQ